MTYPQQRDNWGHFINPQYSRLHGQIQQQTQALLRERQQWSGTAMNGAFNKVIPEQPYLRPVESQKYITFNSDKTHNVFANQPNYITPPQPQSNPNNSNIKNVMSDRVRQLMQLCKKENSQLGIQLMRVLGQQRGVYNEFMSNGQSSQKTQYFGVNPIVEAQKQSSVNFNFRNDQQQLSNNTSSGNQTPKRGGSSDSITANMNQNPFLTLNQNTLNKTSKFKQVQQNTVQNNPSNPSKLQLGDDLIQMIEQIERKALSEIEKLREEKIDLMKQLKLEIQGNNQLQKEINSLSQQQQQQQQQQQSSLKKSNGYKQLQQQQPQSLQEQILKQIRVQMDNLRRENESLRMLGAKQQQQQYQQQQQRQQQHPPGAVQTATIYNTNNNSEVNTLRQRISLLQGQLRSRDNFIKQLSLEITRLNQQGGTTSQYEISNLLQQGQAIRQQTIQLIRLKQRQQYQSTTGNFFNESQRVKELQELLEKEQEEKENFFNDLLTFKQKYQQLEEENKALKRQSRIGSSDIARFSPIYEKSSFNQPASVDDYERVLSQMRGAGSRY